MRAVPSSRAGRTGSRRRRTLGVALAAAAGVGGLSLGLGGVAGATSSSDTLQSQTASVSKGLQMELKHFNCSTAQQRLSRVSHLDALFNQRYAALQAKQTQKQQAGKTKRADFFASRLAAAHKEQGRLENSHFRADEAKVAKLAQQKCHISAPPST
ncbi:MAG: hypothetical protein JO368_07520 [Acidimicrobiales bacterium]|nr:hypothetical protein [Acidimicrobiales bacterium]